MIDSVMKKVYIKIIVAGLIVLSYSLGYAVGPHSNRAGKTTLESSKRGRAANCTEGLAKAELDLNNVRALILTGGDLWRDFQNNASYEVPKGSEIHALFAGGLWMGGKDKSGQLKVAAQAFRERGNDFWPGPLSTITAEVSPQTCSDYDKHFRTTKVDVARFVAWYEAGLADAVNGTSTQQENFPDYQIPESILDWPANGDLLKNEAEVLAPYIDRNGDGVYDPGDGDYPKYDLKNEFDCTEREAVIYGDQNLWWIFNDKGNVHTQSGASSIGLEIRAQAFAFASNDEVNNMTFYNYEIHNRSSFTLTETYFGQWVDPDLGRSDDDYVGCDVSRGLGYVYNGDDDDQDGQQQGYGVRPPALGIDFFQGPFLDRDGKDNIGPLSNDSALGYNDALSDNGIPYKGLGVGYGDTIKDNERMGMFAFLYHDNVGNGPRRDPRTANEYYGYLRGFWTDGSHMVYGGNGHKDGCAAPWSCVEAEFMFPNDSHPVG